MHFLNCVMSSLTLSLPRSLKDKFSALSTIQFEWCYFREFGIGSTKNPLIDFFSFSSSPVYSYLIDVVRRNSVLATHGSEMVRRVIFTFTRLPRRINMRLRVIMVTGKQASKQTTSRTQRNKQQQQTIKKQTAKNRNRLSFPLINSRG